MLVPVKTEPSVPRVLELLVPRYTDVGDVVGSVPVSLDLSASLDVQLVFWERSGVTKELECVNVEEGCPRCKFESFLRGLVILKRRGVLHINGAYVVEGDSALLRLHVEGLADVGAASELGEFEFVRRHLQMEDDARAGESEKDRVDAAKRSRCHVLGCTVHRWKASRTQVAPEHAKALRSAPAANPTSPRISVHVRAIATPLNLTPRENIKTEREESELSGLLPEVEPPTPSIDGGTSPSGNNLVPAEPPQTRKLNLPDVFASLMARVELAPTELWSESIPGLDLNLYEHQRRGLSWMMKRENPSLWDTILQHPFGVPGRQPHESDQSLEDRFGATAYDACGGMLCDEPGLGKTITMLALILLTKGQSTKDMPARVDAPTSNTANVQLRSTSRGPSLQADEIVSSSACLIVVPDALVEHWEEQIEAHVIHGGLKTYVDRLANRAEELPTSNELAGFDVVIISFSRIEKEWRLHRPPSALEAHRTLRYGFEDQPDRYFDGSIIGTVSSLLSIHWLRVIVDEGHKLGGRAPTQLMQLCRLLCAERRWVMTGTPSPNTLQSADLQYIHGLLVFLRNQPYGRPDGFAWSKAIARPFQRDEPVAFYRLQSLLSRIMIRHTKDSIRDILPRPIRHTVVVDPTPTEFKLYNAIAERARANLVVTTIDLPGSANAFSGIHPKSLLHRKNRKDVRHVETALAFAFMGGYAVNWTVDGKSKARTVEKLRSHGVSESRLSTLEEYLSVADTYVKGVLQTKKTRCGECGLDRRTLMVLPCGHLCCAYCINEHKQELGVCRCSFCDEPYDEDTFRFLQPTLTGEVTARGRDSTLGKLRSYGVSGAKITRVAAYLDTLKPKPATECLSCHRKLHLLLILACGHLSCPDCVEKRFQQAGPSCTLCHEPFSRKGFRTLQPSIRPEALEDDDKPARKKKPKIATTQKQKRKRTAPAQKRAVNYKRDYWQIDSSKAFYMVTRIRELMTEFSHSERDLKVIVFSQFRESIWRTRLAFRQQDIPTADFIALINPRERIRNLEAFRSNPNVHVLLLSSLGSHGLDLFFVSHVFLLEEIWDKSVEMQVISRAHRMGATHSVVVEQLWMRGTVECQLTSTNQQLFKSEQPTEGTEGAQHQPTREEVQEASSADKNSFQHMKMNYILNNLRVLEDDTVGKDGEVRFSVRDESETVIRQGVHTISASGEVTTVTTVHNPSQTPAASSAPTRASHSPQRRPISTTDATQSSRTTVSFPEVIVIEDSSNDECSDSEGKCDEHTCTPVVPVRKPRQDVVPVKKEPVYIEIKGEETESE